LESLHLRSCQLGGAGVQAFSSGLGGNHSLRRLYLADNQMGDQGLLSLSGLLQRHRAVHSLEISFNAIGADGLLHLSGVLVNYRAMRVLKLDNNKIGDRGAGYLATAIRSMLLEELYVGYNELGPMGVLHLISSLQGMGLRVLQLSGNSIGADGAHAVAGYLAQDTTLTTIYLDHSGLGAMGERQVAAGIATNRSSALSQITGFELGVVLTLLGSPPVTSGLKNEDCLRYLRDIWAQHEAAMGLSSVAGAGAGMGSPSGPPAVEGEPLVACAATDAGSMQMNINARELNLGMNTSIDARCSLPAVSHTAEQIYSTTGVHGLPDSYIVSMITDSEGSESDGPPSRAMPSGGPIPLSSIDDPAVTSVSGVPVLLVVSTYVRPASLGIY